MGRKSRKAKRRSEILAGFCSVLADHGYAGATMLAIAEASNLTPGLLHHYFQSKEEMLEALLAQLMGRFRERVRNHEVKGAQGYIEAALSLGSSADKVEARCWVGVMGEALRQPIIFDRIKRHISQECKKIEGVSGGVLNAKDSSAIMAFIMGSLMFGAFVSTRSPGFASDRGVTLLRALESKASSRRRS